MAFCGKYARFKITHFLLGFFPSFLFLVAILPLVRPTTSEVRRIGLIQSNHLTSARRAVESLGVNDTIVAELIPATSHSLPFDQVSDLYATMIQRNYIGIIGPYHSVVTLVAEKLNTPYMMTSFGRLARRRKPNIFRMLPDSTEIAACVFSLIDAYQYRRVGIVCEHQLESLMLSTLVQNPDIDVKLWEVPQDDDSQEERIRSSLVAVRRMDIRNILVLAYSETASRILAQGRRLGITAKPYSWIFLNLGSEDFVGDILQDLITNVTAVRFVQTEDPQFQDTVADHGFAYDGPTAIESVLVQDATNVLVQAHRRSLGKSNEGTDIVDEIGERSFSGLSGNVDFNHLTGQRNNFSFSVEHYTENNFTKIAEWSRLDGLIFYENDENPIGKNFGRMQLAGSFASVVTILERPWMMVKEDVDPNADPSEMYEGYVVDIMKYISEMLDFTYELYIVHDGNFGSKEPSGEWNGIMGEILCGNATMSLAPLSINSEREDAVDFTKPFKSRGITVLIKTPEFQSSYFQFMRPFTDLVWLTVALALLVVSVVLYFLEKYSKACRTDMPKLNATESFWFIFGSIVQGSTESSPVTTPGRILTSAWWFFSLILISTYTANLAAFLTVKKINPPISTVADLTHQSQIRYGTVRNSGVASFFMHTKVEPFAKMYEQMQLIPENFVNTTEEGLALVKGGDYAFLWDNSVNSYVASQDCDFTEIGPAFDHKGFGIGLPQGSIHTEQLSLAILKLSDQGVLSQLEKRWWGSSKCSEHGGGGGETAELELVHVAGMFFVLLVALLVGFCACLFDKYIGRKRKIPFLGRGKRDLPNDNQDRVGSLSTSNL